jgi:hypothetical protein
MKLPRLVGGARSESDLLYAFAGALLLGGPLWRYLYVERYPLRPEWLVVVGLPALAGALGAVIARRLGGVLGAVAYGALVYLFVDLQFDIQDHVRAPLLLALAVFLALLLQQRRAAITCITLGALYAAALPRLGGQRLGTQIAAREIDGVAARADNPVIVHVILDEQWGVGGLRAEGDTATASFLTDFYLKRGFELYPAAYSRNHQTAEAIPSLLSLGEPLPTPPPGKMVDRRLASIPYFDRLRARGYTIRVYQNLYLDYCVSRATPVVSCETQSGNSVANYGYLGGSALARAELAARYFLNLHSHLYRRLRHDPEVWRRSSAGGGMVMMRHARDAIASGPRASAAYFLHPLLPHRPIDVDADCRVLDDPGRRVGYEQASHLSDSAWRATRSLIGGQIRCAHRELDAILTALDARVGRDNAIVIIHGDHGPRVYQNRPDRPGPRSLDERQLNGRFATLLAVRRPGVPARVAPEPVPVQDFLWRLARQDFRGPVAPDYRHYVRSSRGDSLPPADSIRALTPAEMIWAR